MTGEIVRGIVQGSPKARVSAAQRSPVVHLGKEAEEEEQVQHLGRKMQSEVQENASWKLSHELRMLSPRNLFYFHQYKELNNSIVGVSGITYS